MESIALLDNYGTAELENLIVINQDEDYYVSTEDYQEDIAFWERMFKHLFYER
jgi:hypothetical protein